MAARSFSSCEPATDSNPILLTGRAPVYPVHRLLANEEGYTIFEFDITTKGRAGNFKVVESSHPNFYAHARAAVAEWVFEPAMQDGIPVTVRCQLRQEFTL